MKKLGIALITAMTISAPAFAADMAARPMKAPPMVAPPVASWTGCYIGAGGGGAYTTDDHYSLNGAGVQNTVSTTNGARGWFGTVQAGCDYQFNNFVVGAFGDYDFMDVKGDAISPFVPATGSAKQDWQWSVGGRVGYLVFPQLLTYVSGGYTQAHYKAIDLTTFGAVTPTVTIASHTRNGWFIGTGDEYAMSFLPGLFWKTEYRYSEFDRANIPGYAFGTTNQVTTWNEKNREHSVRSELVYRFNWNGR